MSTRLLNFAPFVLACWLACAANAQSYEGVIDLEDRLRALDPAEPMAYFLLAEEVAYEIPGPDGRALAERLYLLSLEADLESGGRYAIAASACIALADLTPRPDEREWLRALARSLRDGGATFKLDDEDAVDQAGRLRVAQAISLFRGEAFRKARERLVREDGAQVFRSMESDLGRVGMTEAILDSRASCPECRNRRTVRDGSGTVGGRESIPCGTCKGNPGARLTDEEFVSLLVIEANLRGIEPEAWSARYLTGGGEAIRDVDPTELPLWYGVDPKATEFVCEEGRGWRTGRWVRPAD